MFAATQVVYVPPPPTFWEWVKAVFDHPKYIFPMAVYYWPWTLGIFLVAFLAYNFYFEEKIKAALRTNTTDTSGLVPGYIPRWPTERDKEIFARIDARVKFFVTEMRKAGNPGLTSKRPAWRPPSGIMQNTQPINGSPAWIKFTGDAWWFGKSCITPDGQWEYHGTCVSYQDFGDYDEFAAWWAVSSQGVSRSLEERASYPGNRHRVTSVETATMEHALDTMTSMMEHFLPSAAKQLRAII